jgi:glycosyltransferase involved in cell wall biosynthesis
MLPASGPWGGSSTFVTQLSAFLEWRGFEVGFKLTPKVNVIILIDPRTDLQNKSFGMEEVSAFKDRHPLVRVLHRINECDQRKNTRFIDSLLAEANRLADYTVFISEWLKEYHAGLWFDPGRAHQVIYNGADPRIFHPIGAVPYEKNGVFRLVTHHWSDNPMKGFPVYQQVDRLIEAGELPDTEFWVIGRWPKDIQWKKARTFPPTQGVDLADKLRSCQAYITASLWEPCGMHHVEGAQCGLPLIYHEDGGGIVESGLKYGIGFRTNLKTVIEEMKKKYPEYRQKVVQKMPSGDRMCLEYTEIIQSLLS